MKYFICEAKLSNNIKDTSLVCAENEEKAGIKAEKYYEAAGDKWQIDIRKTIE